MLASVCFAFGVMLQDSSSVLAGKALPLSTQPVEFVKGIPKEALVSVTEYRTKPANLTTRVYRYVYKGDYAQTVKMFERSLLKTKGWRSAKVSDTEIDFWVLSPVGKLAQRGVIIQATRLVKDRTSPSGWSPLPPDRAKGWIWISYNESTRALSH